MVVGPFAETKEPRLSSRTPATSMKVRITDYDYRENEPSFNVATRYG